MDKLIIENHTQRPMCEVLLYAIAVISHRRVSNGGTQYCYATRFPCRILIESDLNHKSDRLIIMEDTTHA